MSARTKDHDGNIVTEEDLDEALRETFPASDPAALTPHPPRAANVEESDEGDPLDGGHVEEGYALDGRHEDGSRNLTAAVVRLELNKELADLWRSQPVQATGHSAKTLVKHADLRVVLIALNAGASLGDHQTPGRIELQVLEGKVRLRVQGELLELSTGGWVALAPEIPYDLDAIEASAVLLTITWPLVHEH